MSPRSTPSASPAADTDRAATIAGQIQTLLSHYYQPDQPSELTEAALADWVDDLAPFSTAAIDHATRSYRRDQPRKRPTPADIRRRAQAHDDSRRPINQAPPSPVSNLSPDECTLLANTILPRARQWLDNPDLCKQGAATLAFWGNPISVDQAMRIRTAFAVVLPAHNVADPQAYRDALQDIQGAQQPNAAPDPDPIEDLQW